MAASTLSLVEIEGIVEVNGMDRVVITALTG